MLSDRDAQALTVYFPFNAMHAFKDIMRLT